MSLLTDDDFKSVITNTPLFSFDFLIKKTDTKKYLVGLRNNAPAKGFWFVPGGRIRKDEKFHQAFSRLVSDELGIDSDFISKEELEKLQNPSGRLYIHHYPNDNVYNLSGINTHYIVFPIRINLNTGTNIILDSQHEMFKWKTAEEIINDNNVHPNTKAYFKEKVKLTSIDI